MGHKNKLRADKAYDADWLCRNIEDCGAVPNIPNKANGNWTECFSQTLYHMRNAIERFYSKIIHYCRIATRYAKKGANNLAMIKLTSTIVWMRFYESMK